MKRLLGVVLSFALLVGCFNLNVFAEETVYPKVSHTYTTTNDFTSDDWSVDQRGAYLGSGTSSIARAGSTTINISGATNATRTCDKIKLILYVERSTSYSTGYSTYKSYSYTSEDVYSLVKGISNISVERGYYYRVKGVHSVTENGITETTDSVTDPIDYR